jgi:hypothetical protein
MATLMGAEEWGIATSAHCSRLYFDEKMPRNTCPVGSQPNGELRKKFTGKPIIW